MSDAFLGWYFAHPDEHLANGDGRPIVLGETHRRSGRGGSSSFLWLMTSPHKAALTEIADLIGEATQSEMNKIEMLRLIRDIRTIVLMSLEKKD